jgi:anti-sigma factor (TIGR02949 family)
MTCQELDRFLYPYLDGEFQPGERSEVEAHLAACASCTQRVEQERRMRQALRHAARQSIQQARAPQSLRAGIQGGLQREQRRAQVRQWVRVSAVALVVVAAGGTWLSFQAGQRHRVLVDDAVRRHTKALPYEIAAVTPEGVEQWFDGKLDHPVTLPRLPKATVSGARISNVADRPAAFVTYETAPEKEDEKARRISLFVFDDRRGDVKAEALPAVQVDTRGDYKVVVWRENEIVYEMVTDFDEQDIRKMLAEQGSKLAGTPPRPVKPDVPVQPASLRP